MCSAVWGQKGKIQNKNRWEREETWWKVKWPLPKKVDEEKINRLASRLRENAGNEAVAEGRDGSQAPWTDLDFWRAERAGIFALGTLVLAHLCSSCIGKIQNRKKGGKVPLFPWSICSKISTRNVTLSAKYFAIFSNVTAFSCGYWLKNNCSWMAFFFFFPYSIDFCYLGILRVKFC